MDIFTTIHIEVNDHTYLKDPESSDLGKRIITGGIELMDEVGFEAFNFKQLANKIGSTEASIYRYFESKHKLLLYLTCWYWSWMDLQLVIGLNNISSPRKRLEKALDLVTKPVKEDKKYTHIDETKLHRVVQAESSKAYLNRAVDEENREGIFLAYKNLVARISEIIKEINPNYKYPHMLVSTLIETAHHQRYFAEHLPRLTDIVEGEDSVSNFCFETAIKTIK